MKWLSKVLFAALLFFLPTAPFFVLAGGTVPGVRPRNDTLRLPAGIPVDGHQFLDAFPGLTFEQPVALAFPPGETNRLFVVERLGRIQAVTNLARPNKTLFLDVSAQIVGGGGEGGLLGLAFHPGFTTNRFFFVFQTVRASTTGMQNRLHDVVARFEVSADDPAQALTNSETRILAQADDSDQHNGGDLKFGPDGYLYISIGERVNRELGWPDQTPLDRDLQGAILRIDVDGRPGSLAPNPHPASTDRYWIPADNPFIGVARHHGLPVNAAELRTELYAIGFRNPWRMAFDPVTGDLYAADVGEAKEEEIDLVLPGADYGWPYFEGFLTHGYTLPEEYSPRAPLHAYTHGWSGETNGFCIVGGVVYRGAAMPWLQGRYLFTDFFSGYLWALQRQGDTSAVERIGATTIGVSAFGNDPRDGEVLAAQFFQGTILRLVHARPDQATNLPPTLADTGIFANVATLTPNPGVVPYEINVPFWSDHAVKTRWFSLPETNMTFGFSPSGVWSFPTGAVWVKHFELELTNGQPASARRLETRVLVNSADGFYGLTYRWGDSLTNAWLVPEQGRDESFTIRDASGAVLREQNWRYPSRAECMNCHTKWAGGALGFSTAQLNRGGHGFAQLTNQLMALATAGYLDPAPDSMAGLPALARADDASAPLEFRVRSYFQANCSACHVPGAHGWGAWDARFTTPLGEAGIISEGGVIKPGSLRESRLYHRLLGFPQQMPPVATSVFNSNAIDLVSNWITNLPAAPWSHQTIGDTVHHGGSIMSNGVYLVGGTGRGFQDTNDVFQFLHRPFDHPSAHFLARLVSHGPGNENVAGLMVRDSTSNAAPFISVVQDGAGMVSSIRRLAANGLAIFDPAGTVGATQWMRIVRLGDRLSAFRADDGTNWTLLNTAEWEPSSSLRAGFAVHSGSSTAFNNATFDNASYLSISLASPAPGIVQQPADVALRAEVEHSGRPLARVEFYDGAEKIGQALAGPYTMTLSNVWAGEHEFIAIAIDEAGASVASLPVKVTVRPHASVAARLMEDRARAGDWVGRYGAGGYLLAGFETNLSAFVSIADATAETWADDTNEPRALKKPQAPGRIAAGWRADESFTLTLTVRDGDLHQVSLYFLDWGAANQRVQRVEFLEAGTAGVLASHTVSNFSGGVYLTARIRGSVDVRVTRLQGPDAVLSGVFLDGVSSQPPFIEILNPVAGQTIELPSSLVLQCAVTDAGDGIKLVEYYLDGRLAGEVASAPFHFTITNLVAGPHTVLARAFDDLGGYRDSAPVQFQGVLPRAKAVFLREDTTTRGGWRQQYGTDGFLISAMTNWWPADLPMNIFGGTPWVEQFADEPDYLEIPGQGVSAFTFLFSYSDIIYDLNFAKGRPRSVALYFFDDSIYPQAVNVADADTGHLLDSRTVTNGLGGRHLVWSMQGHVSVRVSNPASGSQTRVNALFLDPFTNPPPQVSLIRPVDGLAAATPAKILLEATASAAEGIRSVEFWSGRGRLGEALLPPFQWLWEHPEAGEHRLFARAVSAAGAAGDSREAAVRVDFVSAPKVRFVHADLDTKGLWQGAYGTEGYWLPSNQTYSNLPPFVSVVCTQAWVDYGYTGEPRALSRPGEITRILSFWRDDQDWRFTLRFSDGRAHRLSLYNYAPGWTNPITVSLLAVDTGTVLDAREISGQDTGTYLTWDIRGEVAVQITAPPETTSFLNGIFIDPTPDPYYDWQKNHFTLSEQANPSISGETANPDVDAYENWAEFLLAGNPLTQDTQPPLWLTRREGGLFLHVLVGKTADEDLVIVESSPDLKTWNVATGVAVIETHDQGDNREIVRRLPLDAGQTLFYRLRLVPFW